MIRIAVGPTVVYEDLERRPNDLGAAMQRLQDMIELGHLELRAHEEFDMLLSYDDGTLNMQVDFDFRRDHAPGAPPALLRVRAKLPEMESNTVQAMAELHAEGKEELAPRAICRRAGRPLEPAAPSLRR